MDPLTSSYAGRAPCLRGASPGATATDRVGLVRCIRAPGLSGSTSFQLPCEGRSRGALPPSPARQLLRRSPPSVPGFVSGFSSTRPPAYPRTAPPLPAAMRAFRMVRGSEIRMTSCIQYAVSGFVSAIAGPPVCLRRRVLAPSSRLRALRLHRRCPGSIPGSPWRRHRCRAPRDSPGPTSSERSQLPP